MYFIKKLWSYFIKQTKQCEDEEKEKEIIFLSKLKKSKQGHMWRSSINFRVDGNEAT